VSCVFPFSPLPIASPLPCQSRAPYAVPVRDRVHRNQVVSSELRRCQLCKKMRETIRHLYYECRVAVDIKRKARRHIEETLNYELGESIGPRADLTPQKVGADISGDRTHILFPLPQRRSPDLIARSCVTIVAAGAVRAVPLSLAVIGLWAVKSSLSSRRRVVSSKFRCRWWCRVSVECGRCWIQALS